MSDLQDLSRRNQLLVDRRVEVAMDCEHLLENIAGVVTGEVPIGMVDEVHHSLLVG